MKKSFTLLEITITIALIGLIAVILLALNNPAQQVNKANDGKRKYHLTQLSKSYEEYYNDKDCYPAPADVCYDDPQTEVDYYSCHICGTHPSSPDFSPYVKPLPCDPRFPAFNYEYQVNDLTCPTEYKIYAQLAITTDPVISQLNLSNCGYNYGVSSQNTQLACVNHITPTIFSPTITPIPRPTPKSSGQLCSNTSLLFFINTQNECNTCGDYEQCQNNYPSYDYFIDSGGPGIFGCTLTCIKD